MSTRFDDEVEASWGRFEERLTQALTAIGEDSFAVASPIETEQGGASPYVQFAGYDEWIRAEVSGNEFHDEQFRLDEVGEQALESLGWQLPSDDQSPNFWFDVPRGELDVLPTMVTAAFRQVFGVVHPEFLLSERVWPAAEQASDSEDCVSTAGEDSDSDDHPVMGFPDDRGELVQLVERALAQVYGEDLVRDEDGDFPINTGTVPIWVRVHREQPMVRLFSFVVRSVRDVRQARIELGILNHRQDYLKFVLEDGVIMASFDLPAAPFFGPQLTWTIDQVAEQLNELAGDTAARVGGKLWFDTPSRRSADREESA